MYKIIRSLYNTQDLITYKYIERHQVLSIYEQAFQIAQSIVFEV
jgi:hypothetical protein